MTEAGSKFIAGIVDRLRGWAVGALATSCVTLLALVFTPLQTHFMAVVRAPAQLAEVLNRLDALTAEVQRATGEDRVIYEAPGLSFVREPVYVGDQITLNIVVRRTRLGAACTLRNRTALFTDENNIASAGATTRPARQITATETPIRLLLDVPSQVQPGRVTVSLSLEFDCNGRTIFDITRPVAFALLERPT